MVPPEQSADVRILHHIPEAEPRNPLKDLKLRTASDGWNKIGHPIIRSFVFRLSSD